MRFKSDPVDGFEIFAVTGTNTVSFGIKASKAAKRGLLGFAVKRKDDTRTKTMSGFKLFPSSGDEDHAVGELVSTMDHPIQSFFWDDFTCKPKQKYLYQFLPVRGTPTDLDHSANPVEIEVETEELFSDSGHSVFFNRGVASSQAYSRRFGNKKPVDLSGAKKTESLQWLSRDLDEAMLKFINQATGNDGLLCCFYEFRYRPIVDALQSAIEKGVDVRIIIDAKENERTDKDGTFHESFPREENLKTIKEARIDMERIILRDRNPNDIQHNKFMVLLRGKNKKPTQVWTGSTNISEGGIFGQTNVGHWVRDDAIAEDYKNYWEVVEQNLGSSRSESRSENRKSMATLRASVEELTEAPESIAKIQAGTTAIFSPRSSEGMLNLYVELVDSARVSSAVTLAFGIGKHFKKYLKDNTPQSHVVFMLLEKEDRPNKRSKDPFITINASNNVYKAWGSYIENELYVWAQETNAQKLSLNHHVSYIHSKFLLMDPLGSVPIVVTGSANFSKKSTTNNDENMLIIKGDKRVADIYFTEFNRLFNHYYFRSIVHKTKRVRSESTKRKSGIFLDETDKWTEKYNSGTLRSKRLAIYTKMGGIE